MKRCIIYPWNREQKWMIEKCENYCKYEIKSVIPFKNHSEKNGKVIRDDLFEIEKELKEVDILWIVQTDDLLVFSDDILPKIELAVLLGKKVLYTRTVDKKEEKLLKNSVPREQLIFGENQIEYININNTISNIDTPIVMIAGMTKRINKVEYLIRLENALHQQGYKVIVFSDNKEIMGYKYGYWFPTEIEGKYNQSWMMKVFNQYIKKIELQKNPDIILVGIEAGTATFNNRYVEDFGVTAYSVARIARPDYLIFNILFGDYKKEDVYCLDNDIQKIIGEKIDFYNITNETIDVIESENKNQVETMRVNDVFFQNKVDKELQAEDIGKLKEGKDYMRLANQIIDKLSGYAIVQGI